MTLSPLAGLLVGIPLGLSLAMSLAWWLAMRTGRSGLVDGMWSLCTGVASAIAALPAR